MISPIERYNALWRETNALYEAWAKQHQLSYHELLALLSISQADGHCTQKLICAQWLFPKQTTHSILKNFVQKGWIEFVPLRRDRRQKEIRLTEHGKQYTQRIVDALTEHENRVFERLGEKRTEELLRATELYNQYFKGED